MKKEMQKINGVTYIVMEMLLCLFQSIETLDPDDEHDKEIMTELSDVLGDSLKSSFDKTVADMGACGHCLDNIDWDLIEGTYKPMLDLEKIPARAKIADFCTNIVKNAMTGGSDESQDATA